MKLIRDTQKVAVHPINEEGVPAHETWILYTESKHELLVFEGIVGSTEAPFLWFFFLVIGSIYFITQSAKLI